MKIDEENFDAACRAFTLFTPAERRRAVQRFAELRYPSAIARFTEAIHSVIVHLPLHSAELNAHALKDKL